MRPLYEDQLDALRRQVNLQLAIGILADWDLPVTADDGTCPVVVALDEEPLSTLLDRLQATGGYATVFVGRGDSIRILPVLNTVGALDASRAEGFGTDDAEDAPSPDSTVGMFFDYVATRPHGVKIPMSLPERPAFAMGAKELALR